MKQTIVIENRPWAPAGNSGTGAAARRRRRDGYTRWSVAARGPVAGEHGGSTKCFGYDPREGTLEMIRAVRQASPHRRGGQQRTCRSYSLKRIGLTMPRPIPAKPQLRLRLASCSSQHLGRRVLLPRSTDVKLTHVPLPQHIAQVNGPEPDRRPGAARLSNGFFPTSPGTARLQGAPFPLACRGATKRIAGPCQTRPPTTELGHVSNTKERGWFALLAAGRARQSQSWRTAQQRK